MKVEKFKSRKKKEKKNSAKLYVLTVRKMLQFFTNGIWFLGDEG